MTHEEKAGLTAEIMGDLLALIDKHAPVPDYMRAENAAMIADLKELAMSGDCGDEIGELRRSRRDAVDGAREVAEYIAALVSEIKWYTEKQPQQ